MSLSPHSSSEALAVLVPIDHFDATSLEWLQSVHDVLTTAPYAHSLRVVYRSATAKALTSAPTRIAHLALEQEHAPQGIYGAINQAITGSNAIWFLILGQGDLLTRWPELPINADLGVGSCCPGAPWIRLHLSQVCQQDVLYRTAWFKNHHLHFDSRLRANADHLLHLQAMAHRPRIRRVPRFSRYAGDGLSCHHPDRLYHASLPSLRRHHLGLAALISTLGLRTLRQLLGRRQVHQTLARQSRIAVVIVSNRPSHLERCLRALAGAMSAQTKTRFAVCRIQVLCDDREVQQSRNREKSAWDLVRLHRAAKPAGVPIAITLLSETHEPAPEAATIRSSLRNLAAAQASQADSAITHYYFLDGDIETSPATLRTLARHQHQPWVALPVAYSPQNEHDRQKALDRNKALINFYFRIGKTITLCISRALGILPFPQTLYAPTLNSGQLLILTQAFYYADGFQPLTEGWGGEDLYLGHRLYSLGIFPVFTPIALRPSWHIWHPNPGNIAKKQINLQCVSKIILLARNLDK